MAGKQITIPIFIPHEGCPHRCIFCNQWETTSARILPDGEYVDGRIKEFLSTIDGSARRIEVAFFGGSFTGMDLEKQEELLRAAARHRACKTLQGIRLSTRPDYISREILEMLVSLGVTAIEIGAQSFSNRVLEASDRGHSAEDIYLAVELIGQYPLDLVIQLMPGLPCDTRDISLDSARQAAECVPAAVRIYPAVVLKNTGLEILYREKKYLPLSMEDAVSLCSEIHLIFREKDIPVIRTGLHPFSPDELDSIIAGPYHPAFGFMVKSRIRRQELEQALATAMAVKGPTDKSAHILLPMTGAEEYIGLRKENILYLNNLYPDLNIGYSAAMVRSPTVTWR